ncbi:amino acid ABC transporter ATP-binding protein [uncultured Ilyobacter sp.]|uniref:amino acid ABC transporter ATP-binding protein n=1 Tax=uncultured Ilyobacter sp. TaxID=544433 RepID=UPI002AA8285D|nr:amino acid ABC transporter ATP-binding protein [uncultured Ilyobacter sp.]
MNLNITNLTKIYGEQTVLDKLCLNLKDVHSLVIIGPSGGGKSTLLRILAGLEPPEDGIITINNESVPSDEKELRDYRKGVGVVFQAFNLFPHLSAIENITLPLIKVHKLSEENAKDRAISLFEKFQLEEHIHKKPSQLSGGQQQRVAIIRAMALDAKFLLLDEPTSALDPALTSEVLDTILTLRREEKDLVLITHEMGFAKNVADHIIFVDQGKVLEQGLPEDILTNPKTEELKAFLGKTLKY